LEEEDGLAQHGEDHHEVEQPARPDLEEVGAVKGLRRGNDLTEALANSDLPRAKVDLSITQSKGCYRPNFGRVLK
jgi:hypothetical protein